MSKLRLLITTIVVLVLINAGLLGFILMRSNSANEPVPPGGPRNIIMRRLDFNKAQCEAYELLVEDHRSRSRQLHDRSRDLHNALYALLKKTPYEEHDADSLMACIAQNQMTMDRLNMSHFSDIKSICTGEQIEKFNRLVDDLTQLFAPHGPPKK